MEYTIISLTDEFRKLPLIEKIYALINDVKCSPYNPEYSRRITSTSENTKKFNEIIRNLNASLSKSREEYIRYHKELIEFYRSLELPEYYIVDIMTDPKEILLTMNYNITDYVYEFFVLTAPEKYNIICSDNKEYIDDGISLTKFKMIIEKINTSLVKSEERNVTDIKKALQWIYDYPSCNKYARCILDMAEVKTKADLYNLNKFADIEGSFDSRVKGFVNCCNQSNGRKTGYIFIFWSLLILAIDKTDAEKHLSVICNFCVMFGITETEFEDLIHVVKEILHEETIGYRYKSEAVQSIFGSLINQNRVPSDTPKTEYGTTGGHEMNFDAMLEASFSEVKKEDDIEKKGFFGGKKKK